MNWQHLIYFSTTAKLQNFTHAAKQLYITPSALSKAIRNLENELGFPLFDKQGRGVVLTRYGKIFYDYVSTASDNIQQGIIAVQKEIGIHAGRISIAAIYTMCSDYLPKKIHSFLANHPNVTFSMEYNITSKIIESVLTGNYDLGFCGDYETDTDEYKDISYMLIQEEELKLAVPKTHPLAQRESVSFQDLRNEKFVIYRNVSSGISYIFWQLCTRYGFTPAIAFEAPDDQSVFGLVAADIGIALMPSSFSFSSENVKFIRFDHDSPTRKIYMVWNKERFEPSVVSAFRKYIEKNPD